MIKKFKSYKMTFVVALAITIITAIVLLLVSSDSKPYTIKTSDMGRNIYYSSTLSYVNKCGHVYAYSNADEISFDIPEGYSGDIPSSNAIVPMYGYIAEDYIPKEQIGFYSSETVNKSWSESYVLSTMYKLGVPVVWYDDKKITSGERQELKLLAEQFKNQILIMPWLKYEHDELPMSRKYAYAQTGASQSCDVYDFQTFINFLSFLKEEKLKRVITDLEVAVLKDGVLPELE